MPKSATTASSGHEEIEVDTGVADPKKAVLRTFSKKGKGSEEDSREQDNGKGADEWVNRSKAVQRRMASYGRNLTNELTRQFEQTRADDQAKWQRELAETRGELEKLKLNQTSNTTDVAHEIEIKALEDKLAAAHEAGDSKEVARITTLIGRKEAAHMQAKTDAMTGEKGAKEKRERETAKDESKATPNHAAEAKQAQFIRATTWWDDPAFIAERGAANAIHGALVAKGSDPASDDHYRRINKQLKKKFPELKLTDPDDLFSMDVDLDDDDDEVDDGEDALQENANGKRGPVVNFRDRGTNGGGASQRHVKLDASDIATMKAMKLDPTDDATVRQYAIEKSARLAQES